MEFCLIGAGFIGPIHAANPAAHPRTRLRYVVDLNREAAERIATKWAGSQSDQNCPHLTPRVCRAPAPAVMFDRKTLASIRIVGDAHGLRI